MASSSKILTVSYGTFSCTAEGFEDPLAVVKDTTHFFRGIVGQDRFFGAEPPQLDAEMAGELFRQQISAEAADTGLLLRPSGTAASAGAMSAALAAGPAVARKPVPDPVPEAEAAAPAVAEPADDPVEQAETSATVDETVDAIPDEDDIDDAVAATVDTVETETDVDEVEEAATVAQDDEDGTLDVADTGHEADADDLVAALTEADLAEPADLDDVAPVVADAPAPSAATAPQSADPSSVAAKLARIRAVVSGDATPQQTEADYSEDQHANGSAVFDSAALDDMLGAFEDDEDDPQDFPPLDDSAEAEDLPDTAREAAEDVAEDAVESSEDNLFADTIAGLMEDSVDADDDDDDAWNALADELEDGDADRVAADLAATDDDDVDTDEDDAATADMPTEEPAAPLRARVVKVKRAVFEAAVSKGDIEPVDDDGHYAETGLSDEDEDELTRELEAVKAELTAELDDEWDEDEDEDEPVAEAAPSQPLRLDNPVAPATKATDHDLDDDDEFDDLDAVVEQIAEDTFGGEDNVRRAVKMASPARAMLTEGAVKDDDESRILNQTNTQLEEPEGNRRRSAIAHLRAAVAATKADRLLGRKPDAEVQEPYREDLANVVRPRRPQSTEARTERPAEPSVRPAPLKLVAEQRVEDVPGAKSAQPVRPRRVTVEDFDEDEIGDSGFAAYAEQVGATDLPELLEAAAAYMSFVEGRDQFSRPQLMTTVRQAEASESSREDRLRSFGQLLREGKIEKTRGGRFTASERISFKPTRAAG
ncbi:hypothetical protein KUH32_00705 [Thalassococcus sp. CAU 1522]|uniref:Lipoprotein n=1 Tax=Thalassococcus arenae TaxID=2851652 RepID=A0ABS6N2P6_9RHOB|nr:hypothetical protein [Thalassococcus arenae]MBV2358281.1 hypothetical protein [Thalassococcus arenae]